MPLYADYKTAARPCFQCFSVQCDLTIIMQVLLLQCHQPEDGVAPPHWVRHHPPGQAADTQAEHRAQGGLREVIQSAEKV